MKWEAFQLTFRMESPLHSGYAKVGNIQQTRLYVTGRMLWGALTFQIAGIQNSTDYPQIGDEVEKQLRTSYFFPCLDQEGERPILPQIRNYEAGYCVGDAHLKASKAERWLITSYASTAMDINRLAAGEGSLHEVELISHRFLCDVSEDYVQLATGDPVYLTGVFFLSESALDTIKKYWKQAVEHFQVGGERGYGFGRLSLLSQPRPTTKLFGRNLFLDRPDPEVTVGENEPLLAHTIVGKDADKDPISQGILEPFLGRETPAGGQFGKQLSRAKACWVPGAVVKKPTPVQIQGKGLWKV